MEIGEPKKTHTDVPKPHDIPEMLPDAEPTEPKKITQPTPEEVPA